MHFHAEAAPALGHGGKVDSVGEHLGHGDFRFHHRIAALVVHALDAAAAAVEIAHDASGKFVGHGDFNGHDGLKDGGFGNFHRLLESDAARHLKREVVRIYVVIGAVIKDGAEIDHRKPRKVATGSGILDSFFNGGNEVLG